MSPPSVEHFEGFTLPVPLTPLVGREREVTAVLDALGRPETRLVTLTGPGGVGKTRLALAASARAHQAFPDGVCFVDLAALRDPGLVASTVARAVGVQDGGDRPLFETLRGYLRNRATLLILDNFEQVLIQAPLVATLLQACPRLKALVTSRAPLHISGEREFAVPPLLCPNPRHATDARRLPEYEAVALFLQRSQ